MNFEAQQFAATENLCGALIKKTAASHRNVAITIPN
jgi:hypothetical protein